MVRCIFGKRRLLKPPRIKSKIGCPEVDLLTEFYCIGEGLKNRTSSNTGFAVDYSNFDFLN